MIIWKLQDRTCQQKIPRESREDFTNLYLETLQADRELKELIQMLPTFFRYESADLGDLPVYIKQQRAVLNLGLTHKVCPLNSHLQWFHLRIWAF